MNKEAKRKREEKKNHTEKEYWQQRKYGRTTGGHRRATATEFFSSKVVELTYEPSIVKADRELETGNVAKYHRCAVHHLKSTVEKTFKNVVS